jgi:Domain of unknown function (DUF4091)
MGLSMLVTRREFGALALAGAARAAPSASAGVKVAIVDSALKVRGNFEVIDEASPKVRLHAPRNCRETFQIALQGPVGLLRPARIYAQVDAGQSANWFPPDSIELFLAHSFEIDRASNARGGTGVWPDPLVPITAPVPIGPDAATVVWVRIAVASATPVGAYSGAILIDSGPASQRRITFELEVFSPVLPVEPTLPFVVGLDWESLRRVEAPTADREAFLRDVLPGYLDALRIAGATPFNPFDRLPDLPSGDKPVAFDEIDSRIDALQIGRANTPIAIPFSLAAPVDSSLHPLFSESWRVEALRYLRQVASHYEQRDFLRRCFLYLAEADEPIRRQQIEQIARFRKFLSEADPRIRMAQTIHARCLDCETDTLQALEGPSVLWTPNVSFYDGKALAQVDGAIGIAPSGWPGAFDDSVRRSGREIWWYFNPATDALAKPSQPNYPNLYIDHDAMAHRIIGWMAWDQQISAYGHWMATFWRTPANPWSGAPRGEAENGPNGDGVLLYPAHGAEEATGQPMANGPATSIRLEMLRETGQDHKLLVLAEQRLGRDAVRPLTQELFRGLEQFTLDPRPMREARLAILKSLS